MQEEPCSKMPDSVHMEKDDVGVGYYKDVALGCCSQVIQHGRFASSYRLSCANLIRLSARQQ
ncbi:MAG: hypothetical protein MZV63_36090 [Marinilabiliales bacterium]|nr:hypothetical protein [Marinilabiliales bacterium]